jgi:hypothetical protein
MNLFCFIMLHPGMSSLLSGSAIGLLMHPLLKRHEASSILGFSYIPFTLAAIEYTIFALSTYHVLVSQLAFLVVLASSILYYRVVSPGHPLHHVPGPLLARSTQIWLFWRLYRGHPRQDQLQLHEKYGPVVRIGPNEVSICDAGSLNVIYGGKPWLKGKSYSFTASGGAATQEVALSAIRDRKFPAVREDMSG